MQKKLKLHQLFKEAGDSAWYVALYDTRVDVLSTDFLLDELLSHDDLPVHDDVVDTSGELDVSLCTAWHLDDDGLVLVWVPNDEVCGHSFGDPCQWWAQSEEIGDSADGELGQLVGRERLGGLYGVE